MGDSTPYGFAYTELGTGGYDPLTRLAALRAADAATRPAFYPFYGHRPRGPQPGPWVLSQWYAIDFTVDETTYPNMEVFMMAAKARLFDDGATLARILATRDPRQAKQLGRTVAGFTQQRWDAHAYRIVVAGNLAKFGQNPHLRAFLDGTGDAVLVEASPTDRIWGVGLRAGDPATGNPARWRGTNLLGFALTEVRDRLRPLP